MKKLILLSLILITGVPISCINSTNESNTYRIEKLGISVGQFLDDSSLHPFQEMSFDPAPADTLSSSDLAIEIRVDETSQVIAAKSPWFISSAFALRLPPSVEDKLSLLTIYSDEPIFTNGIELKAGDNLNNLFSISSFYHNSPVSVLKFIQNFDAWYLDDQLYLTLIADLDQPLSQSLKMDFTFENGKVISLESAKIVVK